jgi:photosystem II stability/assembly factor-like uncharacterized protein
MRLAAVALAVSFFLPSHVDAQINSTMLGGLEWRGVGPAATGGRIADLAVVKSPGQADIIYVATTTGGVFKSVNAGISFAPIFDHAGAMMSTGAVAVAPSNPTIVWVGTGEADNRQSSSWGDGVYKSLDAGATWQKMGLAETHHVGKIVIHPSDPNVVYVAAVGHLWGSNAERGVFKTTDGGKTWKKILYKDENTGAIDLVMDPRNPDVLYAAMYQHQRKGWGYNGGGPGSGIFRTMDGGASWTELKNGLPRGDKGRIGLATFAGDNRVVYAIVEADPAPAGRGEGGAESLAAPAAPAGRGGRGGRGGAGSQSPDAITARGGIFRSLDSGETWQHMTGLNPRPMYYSRIYIDPKDMNRVYIMGSNRGVFISDDGAHNFREVFSEVHGEDHILWIDPESPNHMVVGGDGGVSISYDRGATWLFRINLPIGQFYNISVNNRDPFTVCGGLQDNGSWCTPVATSMTYGISFKEAYNVGGGDGMHAVFADDHTLLVSSQNGSTGRVDVDTMERQSIGPVQPEEKPQPGKPGYRWYWTSPLIASAHDSNTIYTGADAVFRSDNRGVTWKPISPDLTAHVDRDKLEMMGAKVGPAALSRHDGQTNFSALSVIAESPIDKNILYTGADDGTIQMTRDGGLHWNNITQNVRGLPPMLNISGIVASKYAAGRAYLAVDGHFNDDYGAYVFVSEDFGQTWRAITAGLPETSVHRIREHPTKADLLVIGTEKGVYATFDRGEHWTSLNSPNTNFPPVAVYDLLFQQGSNALVLGTHGRGIWVLDHDEPLTEITPEIIKEIGTKEFLFSIPSVYHHLLYNGQFWFGYGEFFAPNPPAGAVVTYLLPSANPNGVPITITDAAGKNIRTLRGPAQAGLNRACWDLRQSPPIADNAPLPIATCISAGAQRDDAVAAAPLIPPSGQLPNAGGGGGGRGGRGGGPVVLPGRYTVAIGSLKREVTVDPDPHFTITEPDRAKRHAAILAAYSVQQQLVPARDAARTLADQMAGLRQYFSAVGESGKASLEAIDKVIPEIAKAQAQIDRAIASAAQVENAMDGYDGLPTTAQLRQVDWAWEDAATSANALNKLIIETIPAAYASMGGVVKPPRLDPVAVPAR